MRRNSLFFVLFGIIMSWACHEKIIVYPPPRVPSRPPTSDASPPKKPESVPIIPEVPEPPLPLSRLEAGEILIRQGKYPQAIQVYKNYLEKNPQAESRDRALFYLGLCYVLSPGADRNLPGAKTSLAKISKEFPESEYKSPAELILGYMTQLEQLNEDVDARDSTIQKLQEELNRLKEIDLKRRPSRPTEP